MRAKFDEQLDRLSQLLTTMGILCETAISKASLALMEGDKKAADEVIRGDSEVDAMERDIEALCLKLLLQQQPVARDLRQISAALKMITDMERIGDQAADICEITFYLDQYGGNECEPIRRMAVASSKMVTDSINAYVNKDLSLAKQVIKDDDTVDSYFNQAKLVLIKMIADHEENGEYALDLLMIAKYFERIGDHATNIAEWAEYSVTGVHKSYGD